MERPVGNFQLTEALHLGVGEHLCDGSACAGSRTMFVGVGEQPGAGAGCSHAGVVRTVKSGLGSG